jgi:hypothetical protein
MQRFHRVHGSVIVAAGRFPVSALQQKERATQLRLFHGSSRQSRCSPFSLF